MATINVSIINRDDIDLNYDFDALTFNALTVHSLKSIVIIHLYNVYYCYLKAEDVVVIHHGSQITDSNSLLSSLVRWLLALSFSIIIAYHPITRDVHDGIGRS
jgi:hypothetical protein